MSKNTTLQAKSLYRAVKFASHAAAIKHVNPRLKGVIFEFRGLNLSAVAATDGHRVAVCNFPSLEGVDTPPAASWLLENNDVKRLLQALKVEKENWVTVDLSAETSEMNIIGLLSASKFTFSGDTPADYKQATDSHSPHDAGIRPGIVVNAAYLAQACAGLSEISGHDGAALKFETAENDRTIKISNGFEIRTPGVSDAAVYIAPMRYPAKGG